MAASYSISYAPLDAEEECRYNETYADEVAHMMSVREEVISSVREELERKGEARGRLIGREEGRKKASRSERGRAR